MLSRDNFYKILRFVISHAIKHNRLKQKRTRYYNLIYNIITLYRFHEYFLNHHNIMNFQRSTQKHVIVHNQ